MSENELIVYIDTIQQDKKQKSYLITGWALDPVTKTVPKISIASAHDHVTIQSVYRSDVIMAQKLSGNLEAGFQLEVTRSASKLELVFQSGEQKRIETIDLTQVYPAIPGRETNWQKQVQNMKRVVRYYQKNGLKATLNRMKKQQVKQQEEDYPAFLATNEQWDVEEIRSEIATFSYQPKISILMPVYNVEEEWLTKCIQSVQGQFYENWELCMSDDASTDPNVKPLLEKFVAQDDRIKVVFRQDNGHISKATNSALEIATGEFCALLDNDDELAPIALYEVVKTLNKNPELDLIYSDEDKIDMQGNRFDPAFKPDFSPDLLLGTNYISHLGVYRTTILHQINGFRVGYEGSQDYDLVLRFVEQTTPERIAHIPKILYYWRILPTSTAADQSTKGYAFDAGLKAVQDALVRRKIKGTATHAAGNGLFDVHYEILKEELVSVIIPTKNGYDDMKRCLESIVEKTTYPNYEIVVADNGSDDVRMKELYEQYTHILGEKFQVIDLPIPFNYSRINNLAAKEANGTYLLFLNNDTEVITKDWMSKMVSFAQFERIGCVGAKLYYPNHTIQHAGVVLGMGGAAGHPHHTYPRGDFGYFGKLEINVNYSAVTAACLMIRAKDFHELNGFNEELTVAFNDVDLCLREQALGRDNLFLHGVELFHFESQSRGYENTPEKQARFEKETAYMYDKWGKLIENDPYYNPNLTRTGGNFSLRK
ncbi:O-antigen biosynthesis protein [Enterococcus sp. AZ150]|uniref:Glycosyl transferase, group 2 family protein n=1 Tax=Enterococcus sulfureus ATCC 49903 TaxID=1140003 RepID=S0L2I3_9ENTE|nr:glycosyltransferase family 2 protein [Enterococcus sulfureus]EOT47495.1 glycosyl transferase, group 2 family protein [Enterococcus sulfureus ATCC 49903]EOT84084.1 glycosyl transferase, group 2 family protein [Enterococcus sulfureus ATCC 49903]